MSGTPVPALDTGAPAPPADAGASAGTPPEGFAALLGQLAGATHPKATAHASRGKADHEAHKKAGAATPANEPAGQVPATPSDPAAALAAAATSAAVASPAAAARISPPSEAASGEGADPAASAHRLATAAVPLHVVAATKAHGKQASGTVAPLAKATVENAPARGAAVPVAKVPDGASTGSQAVSALVAAVRGATEAGNIASQAVSGQAQITRPSTGARKGSSTRATARTPRAGVPANGASSRTPRATVKGNVAAAPVSPDDEQATTTPPLSVPRPRVSFDGGPLREQHEHRQPGTPLRVPRASAGGDATASETHAAASAAKAQRQATPETVARPRLAVRPLAETIHGLVRVAARGDVTTARITLSPPELGTVEIRLRVRGSAVIAELTAETTRGAHALGQALADLRRSLEAQGLVVQGLEIRQTGPDAGGNPGQGQGQESGQESRDEAPQAQEDAELELAIVPSAPAGEQVDVLA